LDLDRQTIEKRDFPIARRGGYDTAAVDAHLEALAGEVDALKRAQQQQQAKRGGESLASAAAAQVQAIVEAAETTASDIKRQAELEARRVSQDADREAERTRDEAVARAQTHVEEVSKATALMLQRVGAMETEVTALIESLRTGANRLTADLALLEGNMGDLYDAAGRKRGGAPAPADAGREEERAVPDREEWSGDFEGVGKVTPATRLKVAEPEEEIEEPEEPAAAEEETPEPEEEPEEDEAPAASKTAPAEPAASRESEVDARLIALNMALNGQSREEADRYLAENFDIPDRASLLDEVYAAVEG
jgi:hypothetical protein